MVAKELRSAWWKPLVLLPLVIISVLELPAFRASDRLSNYSASLDVRETFPTEAAVNQVWSMYTGGALWTLGILAVLLGSLLISTEASRDTILFLLSRPVSRNRILVTKYAVNAGVLLAVAILGHAFVLAFAVLVRGYPLGIFSAGGMLLSSVLIWLVSLSVLSLAAIFSVLFGNPLVSILATCVTIFTGITIFILSLAYAGARVSEETWLALSGFGERLWSLAGFGSWDLYTGQSFEVTSFLIWPTLAALVLLAALWMFRRRSY